MSALPELNPQPTPEPILPQPRRPRWLWVLGASAAIVAAVLGVMAVRRAVAPHKPALAVHKTAAVRRGTLEIRVRVGGQTSARRFLNVTAPRLTLPEPDQPMTLMKFADSGSMVRAGDVVVQLDPQSAQDHLDDTLDDMHAQENQVAKRKAQLDMDLEKLMQDMRKVKSRLDKARLDMKTLEVRSGNKQELFRLAVEEAEAEYSAMEADLAFKSASQDASLHIAELSLEMQRMHVRRHQRDMDRLLIKAPAGGMAVLQTLHRHGSEQATYTKGDRVAPGALIMRIVDRSSMQVEGIVNQAECGRFRVGQDATIRLDSYPDAVYRGRIYAIGALATPPGRHQYYIRNIPVRLEILNADERVLPDLSASAEVLIGKVEDVLLAPASAVKEENGQSFVYVENGGGVERRPVRKGQGNGVEAALLAGVAEGEIVVVD